MATASKARSVPSSSSLSGWCVGRPRQLWASRIDCQRPNTRDADGLDPLGIETLGRCGLGYTNREPSGRTRCWIRATATTANKELGDDAELCEKAIGASA